MGERKVLNKYIPPDFDPSIIPKMKRDRTKLIEVRMMLPFSLRCVTCGEYMYKGKKFNSKKEDVIGEDYLGIKKIRFLIKCTVCSAEIAFKTDPKNSDYECEWGATRNFELWRENETILEGAAKAREEEEKLDAMKSLENRTLDSKIEMDVLDALDEIKAINQRHERVDTENLLRKASIHKNQLSQTDEELLRQVKFKSKEISYENEDVFKDTESMTTSLSSMIQKQLQSTSNTTSTTKDIPAVMLIKKKRKLPSDDPKQAMAVNEKQSSKKSLHLPASLTNLGDVGAVSTSEVCNEGPSMVNAKAAISGLGSLVGYGSGSSEGDSS